MKNNNKNFYIFKSKDGNVVCMLHTAILGDIPIMGFKDLSGFRQFLNYCEERYTEFEGVSSWTAPMKAEILEILTRAENDKPSEPDIPKL